MIEACFQLIWLLSTFGATLLPLKLKSTNRQNKEVMPMCAKTHVTSSMGMMAARKFDLSMLLQAVVLPWAIFICVAWLLSSSVATSVQFNTKTLLSVLRMDS